MSEMIDLTQFYIPHDYLTVREMYGAKRIIKTFAPLPSVVAQFHAMGYFPQPYHDRKREIKPSESELIEALLKALDATD